MRLLLLLKLAFLTTLGSILFVQSDEPSFRFLCDTPSHPDYATLMLLYNSTEGPNWRHNDGWGSDCDVCRWYGVTCAGGRVVGLELNGQRLKGELPPQLVMLDKLEVLELGANRLSGEIPIEYRSFDSLKVAAFFGNSLRGSILPILNHSRKLERLSLNNNNFSGNFPSEILSEASQLKFLSLSYNFYSGNIPNGISDLYQLESLYLNENRFDGPIPTSIYDLTTLAVLSLGSNRLTGNIDELLGDLINLEYLNLSLSSVTGEIPQGLENLLELKYLDLSNINATGPIPPEIYKLTKLETLLLNSSNFQGGLTEEISELTALQVLEIENVNLSSTLPIGLGDLTDLRRVKLRNSRLSGIVPEEYSQLTKLTELQLASNSFTGNFPEFVASLPVLRILRLETNLFEGCIPESYLQLCNLSNIRLNNNCTFESPKFTDFCDGVACGNSLNLSASAVEVCEGESLTIESPSGYSTYEWSVAGQDSRFLSTNAENSKYYFVTVTNQRGCSKTDSIFIDVLPNPPGFEISSICPGSDVTLNDQVFDEVGTFSQAIPRPGTCDSIVEVTITSKQVTEGSYQETVCFGTASNVNGEELLVGNYIQTLTNQEGCDSILSIRIDEFPDYSLAETFAACNGSTYDYQGSELGIGSHTFPQTSINGCDSTLTITITQGVATYGEIQESFCEGRLANVNGEDFNVPGDYERTLVNNSGCDSILTITITELKNTEETIYGEICQGGSISIEGTLFDEAGSYPFSLENSLGCDSTLTIVITENPAIPTIVNAVACENQGYEIADSTYFTSGPHSISLESASTCDSLIILNLTVIDGEDQTINASTCEGNPYPFNGQLYYEAVNIQDSLVIDGCKSLVTFNLIVKPPVTYAYNQLICEGEDQFFDGKFYTEAGEYFANFQTTQGCDSLVTMNLIVAEKKEVQVDTFVCEGGQLLFDGQIYEEAEYLTIKRKTVQGCDSLITLNIELYERETKIFEEVICEGSKVDFIDGNSYGAGSHSGSYDDGSCIQDFSLIVVEVEREKITETLQICSATSEEFMGTSYTAGGLYSLNVAIEGCKILENLIVIQTSNSEVLNTQVFCEGRNLEINGVVISESGVYDLEPIDSCAEERISILFVNGEDITISQTIEEGQVYRLYDEEYSVAGTYEQVVASASGCSSNLTLELRVQSCGGLREENITLCSGGSVDFYDVKVSEAGTYTYLKELEIGCDSIISLYAQVIEDIDFEINGENYFCENGSTTLSGPEGYAYEWSIGSNQQSVNVSEAGVYQLTIYDENNCASEAFIEVEAVSFPEGSIEISTNNPSTCTANDGEIQIDLDTQDNFLFSIDGGLTWQEDHVFENLVNGSYEIAVADLQLRCIKVISILASLQSIGVPEIEEVVVEQINDCAGTLGSIRIVPADGSQDYIYSIDGGLSWSEAATFSNLSTGIYQVEMKVEGSDCSNNLQGPIDLKNQGNLNAEVNVVQEISCDNVDDGIAGIVINDGLPPYEVMWSDGQLGLTASSLGSGLYGATITDANSCVSFLEVELLSDPTLSLIDEFVDIILCSDEALIFNLDPNYNYTLFRDELFYAEGFDFKIEETGIYQVIVEKSQGCVADKYFTVSEVDLSKLGIDFLLATEGVVGVEVAVVNVSDPMPSSFEWFISSMSANSTDIDRFTKGVTFDNAGTYTISLETEVNGCLTSFDKEIIIYADSTSLGSFEEADPPLDVERFIDWKVYPSPNNGNFQVAVQVSRTRMAVKLKVFDIFGRMLAKENLQGSFKYLANFDLSTSSTGIYTVVLQVSDLQDAKQIMIIR